MAWLEVETKIKIPNANVKEIRHKVRKIAKFIKKEKRADDYFALKRKGYPKKAFRIRAAKDEFVVNFKKWLKKYWTEDIVVKKEFEFNLRGKEHVKHLLELFKDLGFREWIKKIKFSEAYTYKKDKRVKIEINKVKHLGYFIEIEYLCQKREMQKAREKIREVLRELEVEQKDINNTGYTKMLYNKGIVDRKFFLK